MFIRTTMTRDYRHFENKVKLATSFAVVWELVTPAPSLAITSSRHGHSVKAQSRKK